MDKYLQELEKEIIDARHYLHSIPEAAFEEVQTSKFLKEKLEAYGYKVYTNYGKTGLVAELIKGESKKSVAFRSDIDCIKVQEINDLSYKSQNEGRMHACGHDGHMATMLGAAKIIADKIDFNGKVYFVFQPAEEPGYGSQAMIEDGLFRDFKIDEIYGFHNMPSLDEGKLYTKIGGIMASEDNFTIKIKGRGGHASAPNLTIDPMVIAANIIMALQTIVSRNADPVDTAVVSCTEILTDGAHNAIPSNATILGDCRSFDKEVSSLIEKRMKEITENICKAYGAEYEFSYTHEFLPTINYKEQYQVVIDAAKSVLGEENVVEDCKPMMGSEDFAHYLNEIPGCFSFIGGRIKNSDKPVYNLHNHQFDYNDGNLIKGAQVFGEIARIRLSSDY